MAKIFKSISTSVQNEETRVTLAGLILVSIVIWIGNALYVKYTEQNERDFAQKCSANNFSHLSNGICYDQHRHILTFNPDGTVKKATMDLNVWRQTDFADRAANSK